MRVTKVKVDKKDVLMSRNNKYGFLMHGNEAKTEKQVLQLIQQKEREISNSIFNKTLVKEDIFTEKKNDKIKKEKNNKKNNHRELQKIFRFILFKERLRNELNTTYLKRLSITQLQEYFNHKFTPTENGKLPWYGEEKNKQKFNLIEDLHSALQKIDDLESIAKELFYYKNWAEWYIKTKQKNLAKSIINNKIDYIQNTSPRKKELEKWAKQYVTNYKIDLENLANLFSLSSLVDMWNKIHDEEEKYTQEDVDSKEKEYEKQKIKQKIGLPKNLFEFKRRLKESLQSHQKEIIEKLKINQELNQYSLEISKYLMHYFPLKKSGKRLSADDIQYYLQLDTVKGALANQIENAVMQYLLQQGKAINYQLTKTVSSSQLQQIKSEEAFALQFIDACAFAANNLRNCIDPQQQNDILGKIELKASLETCLNQPSEFEQSTVRLSQFFLSFMVDKQDNKIEDNSQQIIDTLSQSPEVYLNFVAAVRSSIQKIRNTVIHYKFDAINSIFSINEFEGLTNTNNKVTDDGAKQYTGHYLQKLFSSDLTQISRLYAEKLKSAGIFDYYPLEDVKKYFSQFVLSSKPLAFIPGFKKIFSWGIKYQEDNKLSGLNLSTFFRKGLQEEKEIISAKQAHYNALGLLYEQKFIDYFMDNTQGCFTSAVDAVINANRSRAVKEKENNKRKNQHAWAFNEVITFSQWLQSHNQSDKSVIDYLKYIHSALIQEENKRRAELTDNFTEQDTGHFQQFLWQVFLKGFDTFAQQSQFLFIKEPKLQFSATSTLKERADSQNARAREFVGSVNPIYSIDSQVESNIAFWTFCKMLDAQHLNDLNNQIIKWRQATNQLSMSTARTSIEAIQEIIQLCLLSVDKVSASWRGIYPSQENYSCSLQPYLLSDFTHYNGVFNQDNGDPVIYAPIELAKKYATRDLMLRVLGTDDKFRLSFAEIKKWQELSPKACGENGWASTRQELHQKWAETEKKAKNNWVEQHGTEYQKLCDDLDSFIWLDNKAHFIHIKKLHHLLIDILGRMAGFVALFDRDFQFIDLGTSPYRNHDEYRLGAFLSFRDLFSDLKKSDHSKELTKIIDIKTNDNLAEDFLSGNSSLKISLLNQLKEKQNFYRGCFFETGFNVFEKRNFIAHFNYLSKSAKSNSSILDILSDIRSLVSHDRKLKNSVTKSFIDILDKHGIELKLNIDHATHEITISSIVSKKIKHLGGKVQTNQLHQEYVDIVKTLLEFKN